MPCQWLKTLSGSKLLETMDPIQKILIFNTYKVTNQ
jgi:hypothetical protein